MYFEINEIDMRLDELYMDFEKNKIEILEIKDELSNFIHSYSWDLEFETPTRNEMAQDDLLKAQAQELLEKYF